MMTLTYATQLSKFDDPLLRVARVRSDFLIVFSYEVKMLKHRARDRSRLVAEPAGASHM